jgi:hypothetical protein
MENGFCKRYIRYNNRDAIYNNRRAYYRQFIGRVLTGGVTSSIAQPKIQTKDAQSVTTNEYDILHTFGSAASYREFRAEGEGRFVAEMLIVGAGLPGQSGNDGVSGAGGQGGQVMYWTEYEFELGVTYSIQVKTSGGANPNGGDVILGKHTPGDPLYQQLVLLSPGGGTTGASSVSGISAGNPGGVGSLNSITGTTQSYGGGGGSGASLGVTSLGTRWILPGGTGNGGYAQIPGVSGGGGGEAARFANNVIDTADNGDSGGSLYGIGGGGGATVWALPFAGGSFTWFNGGPGSGGVGCIMIRHTAYPDSEIIDIP